MNRALVALAITMTVPVIAYYLYNFSVASLLVLALAVLIYNKLPDS